MYLDAILLTQRAVVYTKVSRGEEPPPARFNFWATTEERVALGVSFGLGGFLSGVYQA